jgi:signal transduction histidine kinase
LDIRLGELAETNVALFEANKLKSEFLANVSHELRTPLVSIIGFAELLHDAVNDPPKDASRPLRYAENILGSGRMLLGIINDLLDLAKVDAGKMQLHRSNLSIADVCQALMDFVRPQAEKKNLQIASTIEPDIPQLHSDSGKIQQILHNLLSNAIKFTPSGGRVELRARRVGEDRIELQIEDTGPGIPPEQQSDIFEKFRQLDSSATREHGGTGLGLAITRELTQMLGGTIRVDSVVGQGSTFTVNLPMECPEEAERKLISLT